jgi:prevent-host-death family protein
MVAFRLAAIGGACMSLSGEPKAHFSELVRAAANGELIVLTDYGKPLAVITSIEGEGANRADDSADASKFRQALLALPHHLDVNF